MNAAAAGLLGALVGELHEDPRALIGNDGIETMTTGRTGPLLPLIVARDLPIGPWRCSARSATDRACASSGRREHGWSGHDQEP